MHQKTKKEIQKTIAFQGPAIAALIIVPFFFLETVSALIFIVLAFLATISRSTLIYDSLKVEWHMFLVLVLASLYGSWVGLLIGVAGFPLVFKFAKYFKFKPNPLYVSIDSVIITVVGLAGAFLPIELLPVYGTIVVLVVDHIAMIPVRLVTLPYPVLHHLIRAMTNLAVTYLLLKHLTVPLVAYLI